MFVKKECVIIKLKKINLLIIEQQKIAVSVKFARGNKISQTYLRTKKFLHALIFLFNVYNLVHFSLNFKSHFYFSAVPSVG